MLRRLASLAVAAVILGALAAGPASAEQAGKVALLAAPSGACNVGATSGTDTKAFAVVQFADSKVQATVSLKDGAPNAAYAVSLVQIPSGENCFGDEAEITTNAQGNGTVHLNEDRLEGTTGAFVIVQLIGGFDFRASKAVAG